MYWNVTNQINKLPWRYALEQNQPNSQVCLEPSSAAHGGLGPNHGSTRVPPQKINFYRKVHMLLCSELNTSRPPGSSKDGCVLQNTYGSLLETQQRRAPRLLGKLRFYYKLHTILCLELSKRKSPDSSNDHFFSFLFCLVCSSICFSLHRRLSSTWISRPRRRV